MRSLILLLASNSFLPNLVTACGTTVHETIARLALRFALPETVEWLNKLLPDKGSTDAGMAFISTWPDGYAHQCVDGLWTKGFHFMDAHDEATKHPHLACSARNCDECVVSVFKIYTYIIQLPRKDRHQDHDVVCAQQASSGEKRDPKSFQNSIQAHAFQTAGFPPLHLETLTDAEFAIRFVVHLIGDIHQPLHTTGYELGEIIKPVYFNKKEINLHDAWDTEIPETIFKRLLGGTEGVVDYLYQHAKTMDKSSNVWKNEWVGECFEGIEDEVAVFQKITFNRAEVCALQWARWANHYICTYVLQYGLDTVGMELGGEYTNKAEPIIVELVSMAGWKLGGWLNLLATQKLGLDLGPVKEGVEEEVGEDDHYRGAYTIVPGHDEL